MASNVVTAPVAPVRDHVRTFHGDEVYDPYEWLRDKASPEVIEHLRAENAFTEAQTSHLGALRDELMAERKARTQQTDQSVPTYATSSTGAAYWYYARTVEGQDYAIRCRVPAVSRDEVPDLASAPCGEQVLLDGNAEAEGHDFFALGGLTVSPDGNLLAWSVDHAGDERYDVYVRDLASGQDFGPLAEGVGAGLAWCGDQHLIYHRVDDAWRTYQVWSHQLRSDPQQDRLLYQEDDERFSAYAFESRQRDYVLIASQSKVTSEWRLLATDDADAEPRLVEPRRDGLDYDLEVGGDRIFVVHNGDCPDYAVAWAPLEHPGRDNWRPVLPGREGVRLEGVEAYRDFVVVSLRRDALTGIHILPRDPYGDCSPGSDLAFDEPLYEVASLGDAEYTTDRIRVAFSSLVTPDSVFDCDLATHALTLRKQLAVLDDPARGPYRPEDYEQRREWACAADGTRIPISLVYRRGLERDGSNPCLLYGYGSYEASTDPSFAIGRIALLERGVVFAIAHVRGGGELGRHWYDDGKLLAKRNTFTDFVACAEHLIAAGYTNPDRLAAQGRSAGGLLMGAVANMAPDTFRAIHAGVPFVDALTTILMPELPLTIAEWEEWGDAYHDPEVYEYMKSYSPYENVQARRYPAVLATTSLNDTRVLYVEPAKWVARLRATVEASEERPILLHTEMTAGHGGVSGRYGAWAQQAFEHAWICDQLGVQG